jgi:hypothetical protein
MLVLLAVGAASAQALPTAPSLGGTHPVSPGISTMPRVFGSVGGVSASSLGRRSPSPFSTSVLGEPGGITIYAQPGCTGPEVATGTDSELENSGIEVTVAPGSETTFSATNTEFGVASACSNGIVYQQVSNPPGAPTVSAVAPASPANDNFPKVRGVADAGSTVSIYANAGCTGTPLGTGSASAFASGGIQAGVPDNSTTTFFARASWAELPSACSSTSVTYQEVTPAEPPPVEGGDGTPTPPVATPPAAATPAASDPPGKPQPPQLRTVPGSIANDVEPLVTGSAPGASVVKIYSSPDCKAPALARGTAAQFQAGLPIQIVPNTTIAFYGKSVDGGGDESGCSAVPVTYTDDSIAPRTKITAGPAVKTSKRTVVFRFADITGGPETSFLCKIDSKPWKACQAPLKLKRLGHKRHMLRVKAYDAAGNREKTGAKRSFQVVSSP